MTSKSQPNLLKLLAFDVPTRSITCTPRADEALIPKNPLYTQLGVTWELIIALPKVEVLLL